MWKVFSPFQIFIILLMVGCGSLITILLKWSNRILSRNSEDQIVPFSHPLLQSTSMFLGELFCLGAYYVQRAWQNKKKHLRGSTSLEVLIERSRNDETDTKNKFKPKNSWILMPASLLDMTGLAMMYFGLTLTSVSSFEMLKGAVIIFTAINSRIFLGTKKSWRKWASIIVILCGLIIVGLADYVQPSHDVSGSSSNTQTTYPNISCSNPPNKTENDGNISNGSSVNNEIIGDIMIVGAQLFMSLQFVYEEKIFDQYAIEPLEAVGWEGFYGFTSMSILLVSLAYIDTDSSLWSNSPSPPWTLEDPIDGFIQLGNNSLLLFLFCAVIVLESFCMYGSIAVIKELDATTRMVLESTKPFIIWVVSLCAGWQKFQYMQLIGLVITTAGIFGYNYKAKSGATDET